MALNKSNVKSSALKVVDRKTYITYEGAGCDISFVANENCYVIAQAFSGYTSSMNGLHISKNGIEEKQYTYSNEIRNYCQNFYNLRKGDKCRIWIGNFYNSGAKLVQITVLK